MDINMTLYINDGTKQMEEKLIMLWLSRYTTALRYKKSDQVGLKAIEQIGNR
ncbi:hypothetical protein M6B38_344855 [Iris pallida]|uniref:Uncharacterized protein n=1 Tax=Iris pallida TaxID=29817 RepID=A0AAX6GUH3_IRIPA|nr:hypothetical protein M6B38_344855 [Iris pallida]